MCNTDKKETEKEMRDPFRVFVEIAASRMKMLREEKGLSSADLAQVIGCTEETYLSYESAEQSIHSGILIKLYDLYHVSCDYIVGLTDQREPGPRAKDRPE